MDWDFYAMVIDRLEREAIRREKSERNSKQPTLTIESLYPPSQSHTEDDYDYIYDDS